MHRLIFTTLIALAASACGPPIVELEVDVRLPIDFLQSIEEHFPVAVDVDVEVPRTPVLLRARGDILCDDTITTNDVRIVTLDLEGLRCRPGVNMTAYVYPVDLGDLDCHDLSLNGRQSRSFDSDRDTLLGQAHHEGAFDAGRAACRDGTELVTLEIE